MILPQKWESLVSYLNLKIWTPPFERLANSADKSRITMRGKTCVHRPPQVAAPPAEGSIFCDLPSQVAGIALKPQRE